MRDFRAIALRFAVFAGPWWGLSEGAVGSWLVGLPFVVGATATSHWLRTASAWSLNLPGASAFVGVFLVESLRAGIDVAGRAITLNIAPRIISHRLALKTDAAVTFFAGIVSLLPGTLTTAVERDRLRIHMLDTTKHKRRQLARLESYVAVMFGETERWKRS